MLFLPLGGAPGPVSLQKEQGEMRSGLCPQPKQHFVAPEYPEPQPDRQKNMPRPTNGDDARDFDDGGDTAQKDLHGWMVATGTKVRCNWVDPSKEGSLVVWHFEAASKACERLQARGPRHPEISAGRDGPKLQSRR